MTASKEYGQYRETTLSALLSYTLWNTIGNLNILGKKRMLISTMGNIYKLSLKKRRRKDKKEISSGKRGYER